MVLKKKMTDSQDIIKTALVQMSSGPEIGENIREAERRIRAAVGQGAQFVLTPEVTCCRVAPLEKRFETSPQESVHPTLARFKELAKELDIWLLTGSLAIKKQDQKKIANRSFLINNLGDIAARYDKIHPFDVDLPNGDIYRESDVFERGDEAVIAETPFAKIGLTICYDVRFPYLYRALAQRGAQIITVPSAFTVPTGQAHWETLLRARAIETGAFILAPAQTGAAGGVKPCYGHSLIVAPWGEVLADAGDAPGIVVADLDLSLVDKARAAIPAWGSADALIS